MKKLIGLSVLVFVSLFLLLACGGGSRRAPVVPVQPTGDSDGDTIANVNDNCPVVPNPAQLDCNLDGIGDACSEGDCDGDAVVDRLWDPLESTCRHASLSIL